MRRLKNFYAFFILISLSFTALAETASVETPNRDFEAWKKTFAQEALAAGVSEAMLDTVLPQMKLLPQVIESDKKQPEFISTFWDYMDRAVSKSRIAKGKEMLEKYQKELNQVSKKYGVQPHYIVAFWGMETSYGAYKGSIDTLDALATLAYDKRRRAFFTRELIAFLKIMETDGLKDVKGSWAGAFGNFQFMPTSFEAYAVDGDGDGHRDIVHSLPDAFASAAHFLSQQGWNNRIRWGREVRLPSRLDWNFVYSDQPKTIEDWQKQGVLPLFQEKWPDDALQIQAELTLPMGVDGPAFLTYPNYRIMMNWNRSDAYALSVGILADRLSDQSRGVYKKRQPMTITHQEVKSVQQALKEKGLYQGAIDGKMGRSTKKAVRLFQKQNNLQEDGFISPQIVQKLGEEK